MGSFVARVAIPRLGRAGRFYETYEGPIMMGLLVFLIIFMCSPWYQASLDRGAERRVAPQCEKASV